MVCGYQYGDVSPNHTYRTHTLIYCELAHYYLICKLSARSLLRLSSSRLIGFYSNPLFNRDDCLPAHCRP